MPVTDEKDTKDRILDAAERLFADRGFAQTSLRKITAEADANLAAVNYHFGSKEELFGAVLARRLRPMNRERLEILGQLEAEAGDGGPALEEIIEAFVGTPLRMRQETGETGERFMRLMGRAMTLSHDRVRKLLAEEFREVVMRFSASLARALPHLSPEQILWRFLFMVGAMVQSMTMSHQLETITRDEVRLEPGDAEEMIRRLVPYLAGGFLAPPPAIAVDPSEPDGNSDRPRQ